MDPTGPRGGSNLVPERQKPASYRWASHARSTVELRGVFREMSGSLGRGHMIQCGWHTSTNCRRIIGPDAG